jgi:hypothetical protein
MTINSFEILTVLTIALTALVVIHILSVRLLTAFSAQYSTQLLVVLCVVVINVFLALYVLAFLDFQSYTFWEYLYISLVFNSLAYTYLHIFNMSETARRIKILIEIQLSEEDIGISYEDNYDIKSILQNRLKRLVQMKQIYFYDGTYRLSGSTLIYVGRLLSFFRRVIGIH